MVIGIVIVTFFGVPNIIYIIFTSVRNRALKRKRVRLRVRDRGY